MSRRPTIPCDDDLALFSGAAAGDLDAFAALYGKYQHVVFRFAYSMTGSKDAAEDVVQDVFVAMLDGAVRYDPTRAAFSTYLYGIVRNLCRGRLRRISRLRPIADDDERACSVPSGPFIDHVAEAQRVAAVRRALARVPSRYREVIVLCDLHDLSYADAAVVVRASVSAVRSRLHRGREMLRSELVIHVCPSPRVLRPAGCAP